MLFKMPLVTLIGRKLASEGLEFMYMGPLNDCRNCKLKTVCFNLKKGRDYKITKIRDKQHSCNVHDGNVAVVEVEELPLFTSVEETVTEGSDVKIAKNDCTSIGCVHYDLCTNRALQKDRTYKVLKVYEAIECPIHHKLKRAELSDET